MKRIHYGCLLGALISALLMTACETTGDGKSKGKAPVVDAGSAEGKIPAGSGFQGGSGKAVYHTVQQGDSLYKIASQYGQNWQDIAKWNNLSDPSKLSIGQRLLVSPSAQGGDKAVAVDNKSSTSAIKPASMTIEDRMQWSWPANGQVIGRFDEKVNKGINITGNMSDPVYAAADGRVAYVGDYRSYGKLVIVKHNDIFLTAYAHNSKIIVKENQVVKKGEKIAEMGNTDADRVMLHFEIRQLNPNGSGGKTVDPLKYLPSR